MIFLGYYAVRIIPLDDAIAIIFASPIFSILFEWLLVRKSQGIFYKLGFSLILIAGVILVLQPPFLHFHPEDQVEYSTSEYFGMGNFPLSFFKLLVTFDFSCCIGSCYSRWNTQCNILVCHQGCWSNCLICLFRIERFCHFTHCWSNICSKVSSLIKMTLQNSEQLIIFIVIRSCRQIL